MSLLKIPIFDVVSFFVFTFKIIEIIFTLKLTLMLRFFVSYIFIFLLLLSSLLLYKKKHDFILEQIKWGKALSCEFISNCH